METQLFYIFSGISIFFAFGVVAAPKPTYALLSLIVTMFSLSGLYLLLGAPFVAMVHLIVYAGAVLVLFLFVIMLQGVGAKDTPLRERFSISHLIAAATLSAALFVVIAHSILKFSFPSPVHVSGTIQAVGHLIFSSYVLPFFMTSLLLMLGVFAAVMLAQEEKYDSH